MGISIKLSKVGKRVHPQPCPSPSPAAAANGENGEDAEAGPRCESSKASSRPTQALHSKREVNAAETTHDANGRSVSSTCSGGMTITEQETSFILSLYDRGYTIGKPTEDIGQPTLQDVRSLHLYDRASEHMFAAIEAGRLPGDFLDEVPCKYYNGFVICELRDYRRHSAKEGLAIPSENGVPNIHKVELRMALENVVKDISKLADDSWTYRDYMEVESRIVKALQPELCLDPIPRLDRLCNDPAPNKLNLGLGRKRRLRHAPEVIVTSNNSPHGKKICIERAPDSTVNRAGDVSFPMCNTNAKQTLDNMTIQNIPGGSHSAVISTNCAQETARLGYQSPSNVQQNINYASFNNNGVAPAVNFGSANNISTSSPRSMMGGFNEMMGGNGLIPVKKEISDSQITSLDVKRPKQAMGTDDLQQNHMRPQAVNLSGQDMQWKNQQLNNQDIKGMQFTSALSGQRYPSPMMNNMQGQEGASMYFNQQGMRIVPKIEQIEKEKSKESISLDQQQMRPQYLSQQAMARSNQANFSQWQNAQMLPDKGVNHRRKLTPPSGSMVQSPVSSKSGEFSSGSMGGQFNPAAATSSFIGSQQDKLTNPNAAVGTTSVTSSPSDSMHRLQQVAASGKRKPAKVQAASGVASPSSVGNISQLNASSPSVGPGSMGDQAVLDRFAKIGAITMRYKLNVKKTKADNFPPRKPMVYPAEHVVARLTNSFVPEEFIDETKPMSGSIIGGTINSSKIRKMNFHTDFQDVSSKLEFQCLFREKTEGTVEMHFGDLEDSENLYLHGCTCTLPTKEYADLLAGQYIFLMERDGYRKSDDQVQPQIAPHGNFSMVSGSMSDNSMQDVKPLAAALGQSPSNASLVNSGAMGTASAVHAPNGRLLAPGNNGIPLPMSQGYLAGAASRAQGMDQSALQHQQSQSQMLQQSQIPQMARSQIMSQNSLSMLGQGSNLPLGVNMANKLTQTQLQAYQQQMQQQSSSQLSRKVMAGLSPAMAMGNMGNNVVGLGNLGNTMGMGALRGLNSPIGGASSLGNLSPGAVNLGMASNIPGYRAGSLPSAHAAIMKMRFAQRASSIFNSQPGLSGIAGNNNSLLSTSAGLPMVGSPMNRVNMSNPNRPAMSAMGPPKIQGSNFYLNQQQQQQLHQQQQQQLLQQQQQQIQQQQQQQQQQLSGSPMQQSQVGSPPAVTGSQSSMMMQPQQMNPQMSQQQQHSTVMSPQQLSSGALTPINNVAGNAGAGPASPQLSSQTHGSVGSITSSPIEQLHGANKATGAPPGNM